MVAEPVRQTLALQTIASDTVQSPETGSETEYVATTLPARSLQHEFYFVIFLIAHFVRNHQADSDPSLILAQATTRSETITLGCGACSLVDAPGTQWENA